VFLRSLDFITTLLGFDVGRHEELGKQYKQRQNVNNVGHNHSEGRRFALCRNQIRALRHHGDKLNQLHHGEAGFPPNWQGLAGFRYLGVHANDCVQLKIRKKESDVCERSRTDIIPNRRFCCRSLTVVRVHDGVNEAIQDNSKINVSVIVHVRVEPVKEKDGRVMVDVQKGKLTPLFTHNNKDCVPEVPNLGNIKQPEQIRRGRMRSIVGDTRSQRVAVAVRNHATFNGHVSAQHDLGNIVDELNWVQAHGGYSQLHDGASHHDKGDVGERNVESRRKIGQWPSLLERE
jgi:ribosomal protein S14